MRVKCWASEDMLWGEWANVVTPRARVKSIREGVRGFVPMYIVRGDYICLVRVRVVDIPWSIVVVEDCPGGCAPREFSRSARRAPGRDDFRILEVCFWRARANEAVRGGRPSGKAISGPLSDGIMARCAPHWWRPCVPGFSASIHRPLWPG